MMAISTSNNNPRCKECGSEFLTIDHLRQHITCNMCDSEVAKRALERHMKTLQEKIKEVEKENQLKLFEVRVWGHRDYMVDKISVVTILAKTEDTAKDYAIAQIVNDPRGLDIEVSAREITGPFEAGFILGQGTEFKK